MNNYIKILTHLKQFEADGKFHNMEDVLSEDAETKRIVFKHLREEGLILSKGGHRNTDLLVTFGDGRGNTYTPNYPDKVVYFPYEGQITFKGSEYLKQQAPAKKSKSDIKLKAGNKSNINLIVNSTNSKIVNNSDKIVSVAKDIIKILQEDRVITSADRINAIDTFQTLIQEAAQKSIKQSTWEKVLSVGSNLASIGSLAMQLILLK